MTCRLGGLGDQRGQRGPDQGTERETLGDLCLHPNPELDQLDGQVPLRSDCAERPAWPCPVVRLDHRAAKAGRVPASFTYYLGHPLAHRVAGAGSNDQQVRRETTQVRSHIGVTQRTGYCGRLGDTSKSTTAIALSSWRLLRGHRCRSGSPASILCTKFTRREGSTRANSEAVSQSRGMP